MNNAGRLTFRKFDSKWSFASEMMAPQLILLILYCGLSFLYPQQLDSKLLARTIFAIQSTVLAVVLVVTRAYFKNTRVLDGISWLSDPISRKTLGYCGLTTLITFGGVSTINSSLLVGVVCMVIGSLVWMYTIYYYNSAYENRVNSLQSRFFTYETAAALRKFPTVRIYSMQQVMDGGTKLFFVFTRLGGELSNEYAVLSRDGQTFTIVLSSSDQAFKPGGNFTFNGLRSHQVFQLPPAITARFYFDFQLQHNAQQ